MSAELPRLLLVADGFAAGRPEMDAAAIRRRTLDLVDAGVAFVMLRDHAAAAPAFSQAAETLAASLRAVRPDVRLVVPLLTPPPCPRSSSTEPRATCPTA